MESFKEQTVATYDASVIFLKEMADAVPRIAHANPHQIKRVEKRYRASGKINELAESIERLRLAEKQASKAGVWPLLRHIQMLTAQLEQDLNAEERSRLSTALSAGIPELDSDEHLVSGAVFPKIALTPSPPKLPTPNVPRFVKKPNPPRRRSTVVFKKTTELPNKRRIAP